MYKFKKTKRWDVLNNIVPLILESVDNYYTKQKKKKKRIRKLQRTR